MDRGRRPKTPEKQKVFVNLIVINQLKERPAEVRIWSAGDSLKSSEGVKLSMKFDDVSGLYLRVCRAANDSSILRCGRLLTRSSSTLLRVAPKRQIGSYVKEFI